MQLSCIKSSHDDFCSILHPTPKPPGAPSQFFWRQNLRVFRLRKKCMQFYMHFVSCLVDFGASGALQNGAGDPPESNFLAFVLQYQFCIEMLSNFEWFLDKFWKRETLKIMVFPKTKTLFFIKSLCSLTKRKIIQKGAPKHGRGGTFADSWHWTNCTSLWASR